MSIEIQCPSGLTGTIRGLKGKEAKHLSDRQAVKSGKFMDKILGSCWESTIDPGPYTLDKNGVLDWSKVLVGDRFFALVRVRIETFGQSYEFKVQCGNSACRESFSWNINLLKDLALKKLAAKDLEGFKEGNKLEGTIPWGPRTTDPNTGDISQPERKKFSFRLHTGVDEARMAKFRAQQPALTALVLARIHEIDGVSEVEKRKFIDESEFKVLTDLISEMDKHDCGLETGFDIECPACYAQTEVQLPFERNFLFPQGVDSSSQKTSE